MKFTFLPSKKQLPTSFIGTKTVFLRYGGFTILTDPNFLHAGDHVCLGYRLTSERITEPALNVEDRPPIDFCVLSHYHGDHFDRIAEERFRKGWPIVTTKEGAAALRGRVLRRRRLTDGGRRLWRRTAPGSR